MPVDPQFSTILPFLPQAIATARALAEGKIRREDLPVPPMPPPTPISFVEDHLVPTDDAPVPVRVYAPRRDAPLPLLIYYHGGGFISGDVDSHDELTRQLAIAADCVVVSVSYRLAPANPFPAALHDSLAALNWAVANAAAFGADAFRLAVAGDSAGGNLAAVVPLHVRDKGGPDIAAQLLIYPGTDLTVPYAGSMAETGEGYYMSKDDLEYFHAAYVGEKDPADPYMSPMLASSLAGLPPAFVITAQYDPLRDQGQAYAKRLAESGVPTELVNYESAIHGFLSFPFPFPMAKEAVSRAGTWLQTQLGA